MGLVGSQWAMGYSIYFDQILGRSQASFGEVSTFEGTRVANRFVSLKIVIGGCPAKWWEELRLELPTPRLVGARMLVVTTASSREYWGCM